MSDTVSDTAAALGPGRSLADLLLLRRSEAAQTALMRCALPVTFDEADYEAVLRGPGCPSLPELVDDRQVERVGGAFGYRLAPSVRAAAWALWWTRSGLPAGSVQVPDELAAFGRSYALWQREHGRPADELRGLVVGDQAAATDLLDRAYAAAEEAMDLSRARDLLLPLTADPQLAPLVGPALARRHTELQRRFDTRTMWRNAHAVGARYLHRADIEARLVDFLRDEDARVLRLAAPGGMGKSTTLAWLIAHHCVGAGIPCALVDLDWVDPVTLTKHPWLLLLEVAAQLDVQMPGSPFLELLREYDGYRGADLDRPDGPDVMATAATDAAGLEIESRIVDVLAESPRSVPVLVVVDTIEEAMLRAASDPARLLAALRAVLAAAPQVRLILSGRMTRPEQEQHADRLARVAPGGPRTLEMPPFTRNEAGRYLREVRGITDPAVVAAVIERVAALIDGVELWPWQLALCADYVIADPDITPAEIERLDPALAWSIDRVVGRVPNTALQWLIRYAVVLRRVRRDVAEEVLLPFVVEAMRGSPDDDPDQDGRPADAVPVFRRDSARAPVGPGAFDALWQELLAYTADSSWVNMRSPDVVVLHPSVVGPMRALLAGRPIHRRLHASLVDHFEERALRPGADRLDCRCEAVYHRFQLEGPAAAGRWRAMIEQAHDANDPELVGALAGEVLGPDYLDDDRRPRETAPGVPVVDDRVLAVAHLELAWALAGRAHDDDRPGSHRVWGRVESSLSEVTARWIALLDVPDVARLGARAQFATGALHLARGRPQLAVDLLRPPDGAADLEMCRPLLVRGEALDALGRRAESIRVLEQARRLAEARDDGQTAARTEQALGVATEREGRYDEAVAWMRRATSRTRAAERGATLARVLLQSGLPAAATAAVMASGPVGAAALAALGVTAAAVAAFDKARARQAKAPPVDDAVAAARACAELLDLDRAIGDILQTREACLGRQDHDGAALCTAEAARVNLRHVGNLDQAGHYLDEGMRLTATPGGPAWTALQLVQAELDAARGARAAAVPRCVTVLDALRDQGAARARLLSSAVVALALTGDERFLPIVREHLAATSPASARLVGLTELTLVPTDAPPVELTVGPLADGGEEDDRAWARVRMAEVHRVAGRRRAAVDDLTAGTLVLGRRDAAAWWAWLRGMDRIGPAEPGELLPPPLPAELPPLLRAAYDITLGLRRFDVDGPDAAVDRERRARVLVEGQTRGTLWVARLHDLAARIADARHERELAERSRGTAHAARLALGRATAEPAVPPGGAPEATPPAGPPVEVVVEIARDADGLRLVGPAGARPVEDRTLTFALTDRPSTLVRYLTGALSRGGEFPALLPDLAAVLPPRGERLDLRLRVDPTVAAVPWELIPLGGTPLAAAERVATVRRAPGDDRRTRRVRTAALQRALLRVGADPGPVDGLEGKLTRAAVRSFQRRERIDVDGIAGPVTWRALHAARRRRAPDRAPHVLVIAPDARSEVGQQRGTNTTELLSEYVGRGWSATVARHDEFLAYLEQAAELGPVDVLHACATMDTKGTVPRLALSGLHDEASAADGLPVTFLGRLVDEIAKQGVVPLVVLDVATPPRDSECVRQLLARNDFADQLVGLGAVETVLAAGLGPERTAELVELLTLGRAVAGLAGDLDRLRAPYRSELVPAALFSALPGYVSGSAPVPTYTAGGLPTAGTAPVDGAVRTYRALAGTDPGRFLPGLAAVLRERSVLLGEAGRAADGLASVEEAVTAHRGLAEADPDRFLPELAASSHERSRLLAEVGRPADGLASVEEAVTLRRALAEADPARSLPDLAASLQRRAALFARVARPADGLASIEEAVDVIRGLVAADPDRFRPDLAASLLDRSVLFGMAERPADGLAAGEEAVAVHRELAGADPARFLPGLAASLRERSVLLARLGRSVDGLASIEEAVAVYQGLAGADAGRFLPDLTRSLADLADRLTDVGRVDEAAGVFDRVLEANPRPGWPRGVLLLARARQRAGDDLFAPAAADAVEAVRLLDAAGDRSRHGEARQLLRRLRTRAPAAVARAWDAGELPPWLRHPTVDAEVTQTLVAWIQTDDWDASFAFLAEHADAVLSDLGEAGLEHLVDEYPDAAATLDQHLGLLRDARAHGVDAARERFVADFAANALRQDLEAWIATPTWAASAGHLTAHADRLLTAEAEEVMGRLVAERPDRLAYLALLQISRARGVDEAHALLADPAACATALAAAATPEQRLPLARLIAGRNATDAESHLAHALAAAEVGATDEAAWALRRCRDTGASWQRPGFARRLEEFAAAHPEVAVDPLRRALRQDDDPPSDP